MQVKKTQTIINAYVYINCAVDMKCEKVELNITNNLEIAMCELEKSERR